MRILHALDHSLPLHSGYTFRSQNILRAQRKRGWEVAVATSPKQHESWKGDWLPCEEIEDISYFRSGPATVGKFPFQSVMLLMAKFRKRLLSVTTEWRPDLLHAHSPVLNFFPAQRVARQHGLPLVYEIRAFWEDAAVDHGTYREDSWRYRLVRILETLACRKADHVMVLCDGLRQDLIRRGVPQDKLMITSNGVSPEDFSDCPPDADLAAAWGTHGKTVIGFVGSFYHYEGLDLLLEAFGRVAGRVRDSVLLLVGGGNMRETLEHKARSLGLGGRVIVPGRLPHDQMPGIYALIDVLAYPRYSMRLTELVTPLKPLEAMAMRKAVVASDVGGHRELIRDGETGILFPAGDVAALARVLERVLTDRELREALAETGQRWVLTERTWQKTTAVYDEVYSRLLTSRHRRH